MTTIENHDNVLQPRHLGIYLLEMTTIENLSFCSFSACNGIYLFEMTTIENYHIILISDDC